MRPALATCLTLLLLPALSTAEPLSGEVLSRRGSARFTADEVVGSTIAMSRASDGRWVGRYKGQLLWLEERGDTVQGPGVSLALFRSDGMWRVRGYLLEQSINLALPIDAGLSGWGPLRFTGAAALPHPPALPFTLAILGAL